MQIPHLLLVVPHTDHEDLSCSSKQDEYPTPGMLVIQDVYAICPRPMSNRCFIYGEMRHFMVDCKVKNQYHAECPEVCSKTQLQRLPQTTKQDPTCMTCLFKTC
ncbi:hypothetical protein O6H91_Y501700 [Diphasiastrum complanatum]|nr:hypothetical protein O6H91_Y501700 [Diphasiastrum complanatum]